MKLKGADKFREKIPMLSGKKIIILPLYLISVFTISLLIQLYFDLLPTTIPAGSVLGYFSFLIYKKVKLWIK